MKLLRNRVLVKLLNEEVKTAGGIIVPKTVDSLPTVKAKVVLLGEQSQYGEWWFKVGDCVNMDNPLHAANPMHNYGDCLIVNENDINFVV